MHLIKCLTFSSNYSNIISLQCKSCLRVKVEPHAAQDEKPLESFLASKACCWSLKSWGTKAANYLLCWRSSGWRSSLMQSLTLCEAGCQLVFCDWLLKVHPQISRLFTFYWCFQEIQTLPGLTDSSCGVCYTRWGCQRCGTTGILSYELSPNSPRW